jgi:hypothetical protein
MSPPEEKRGELEAAIAGSEAQRAVLGDAKTWQLRHAYDDALQAFDAAEASVRETPPTGFAAGWWHE